jgi:hypothetical protein
MKSDMNALKNIEFVEHEQSTIASLPEKEQNINKVPVTSYPTIKITVNGTDYNYKGTRDPESIYNFIVNKLKGNEESNEPNDVSIRIEEELSSSSGLPESEEEEQKGGSKIQRGGIFVRQKLSKDDLKMIEEPTMLSEILRFK